MTGDDMLVSVLVTLALVVVISLWVHYGGDGS